MGSVLISGIEAEAPALRNHCYQFAIMTRTTVEHVVTASMDRDTFFEMVSRYGTEEVEIIRCRCQINLEEGEMIRCASCSMWQHCGCMELISSAQANYQCELCKPRLLKRV